LHKNKRIFEALDNPLNSHSLTEIYIAAGDLTDKVFESNAENSGFAELIRVLRGIKAFYDLIA
jgi:hypothetical protein